MRKDDQMKAPFDSLLLDEIYVGSFIIEVFLIPDASLIDSVAQSCFLNPLIKIREQILMIR